MSKQVERRIRIIWAYTQLEEERNTFSESSIDCLLEEVSNRLGAAVLVHLIEFSVVDSRAHTVCADTVSKNKPRLEKKNALNFPINVEKA